MSGNRWWRTVRGAALAGALLALVPLAAAAQTGRISGSVVNPRGEPVSGALVEVVGTELRTVSSVQGRFTLDKVPMGSQQLRASQVGIPGDATAAVAVSDGGTSTVTLTVAEAPVALDALVVSASRRAERITEAPATITRIGPEVLERTVGNTFAAALKEVKGLDFIQTGMTSVAVNARGFNSSFNNRMLMMEDGRISVLPENGLPVGQFTPTPKVDLAGIEVLVGPGSALYGADASGGVIALQTKDPRAYPGTTVEVTGGNRSYRDVQARHAGVFGSWGYKVSGEYQAADDWNNTLSYTTAVAGKPVTVFEDSLPGNLAIDWRSEVVRGTGAIVHYAGENRFELSGGASRSDGVGQTNVGRNQLRDWGYNFLQAKYSTPHWYFNAYRAQSRSGESFALNRAANNFAAFPGAPADSLRLLSDWPSDGRMYAAEAQTNWEIPALRNSFVTFGGQYRQDRVSSDRQWLTDRLTGEDVSIRQVGVYGQSTTPLSSKLDLVLAGRVDDHENYGTQFSPKAGLVFKPVQGQALRATYNRAFKSPTILQTNFYIPDWTPVIAIFGNTQGFTVRNAAGEETASYDALVPEENQTWEVGYKGILGGRMFVDVAAYRSRYQSFLSPLTVISNPFARDAAGNAAPTLAYDADGELIRNAAGLTPLTLIYFNLGEATLRGVDAGLSYIVTPQVNLKGTLSLTELQDVEVPAGREEATALNSPGTKWTLGADFANVGRFQGGITGRYVNGYRFRSGINNGKIPTFSTLDLNVGYRLPRFGNALLNAGVSNLFTCQSENPAIDEDDRECGFGVKHNEMINMPEIGTMLFVGLKFDI